MIPDETVERVRDAADIVGVIGEYVELKRQGADFRGPCPFHQGTHRNFSVSPKKQMYYCFVCHEGGDVFNFLTKRLGVDWPTAVRMVGEKSGIEVVETRSRRDADEKDAREPFWEVNGAAAEYFRRTLWEDDLGRDARAYVDSRGVSRELADRVGLGFAPREIGLMRAHLNTLGFDDDRLTEAGLLVTPEGASEPRPRFRGRLIFPIYDLSNRVVGFGGRLLGPGEPKYLNSPESPIFSKGRLLYGLNWAKQSARRDGRMLVVEGYFDVMRVLDAGIESVVAPMGTALTEDQAKLIRRYTERVYLLYDSDKAGQKATFRSGDELLRQAANVQVVTLPEGEDPDSFVRAHGSVALEREISNAVDVFERKIQLLERGGWFGDLRKKRKALDGLLPTLRATRDPLTLDMYLTHAERVTGVSRQVLRNEMQVATRRGARLATFQPAALRAETGLERRGAAERRHPTTDRRRPEGSAQPTEREVIRVLLHSPAEFEGVVERIGPSDFSNVLLRQIFAAMIRTGPDPVLLEKELDPEAVGVLQGMLEDRDGLDRGSQIISGALSQLREKELNEELEELQRQTRIATDQEKDDLLMAIRRLNAERRALGGRRWNLGAQSAEADTPPPDTSDHAP